MAMRLDDASQESLKLEKNRVRILFQIYRMSLEHL